MNDVHSQLNETAVHAVFQPGDVRALRAFVRDAHRTRRSLSICGGRHSMGGQQFGAGTTLIDTRRLDRVIDFDADHGRITVESGIQWPALLACLGRRQAGADRPWGIYQKQTGADRLTIGGALSSNVHGRGLTLAPIAAEVDSIQLLGSDGAVRTCSRRTYPRLFALALGGYGLFGVITRVTLRLRRRVKLRRIVTMADSRELMDGFEVRIREGFEYGDFQFAIDPEEDGFLRRGVWSCYRPVPDDTPVEDRPAGFSNTDWAELLVLAHSDKRRAFEQYADGYLRTSEQVYTSDDQLSGVYLEAYHGDVDRALGRTTPGSEMITELYVPRRHFDAFMQDARMLLRRRRADVIYGTVRLIERDTDTVLAWARERFACVVLNLHVDHTAEAIADNAETFRQLIDVAIRHGGSFYLTYHRWARRDQVARCYPQMAQFLAEKRRYDPGEIFQSDWYRWYRDMFRA